ncbi:MAG: GDSL-type esterase/lipase family protein [Kiritimatiellia bacterium]
MSARNTFISLRPTALALGCLMLPIALASAGTWKFAVAGDSQGDGVVTSTAWVNTNALRAVACRITNDQPRFVLLTGDLICGSNAPGATNLQAQYAAWSNAFSPVFSAGIGIYPLRGTHETYGDPDGSAFTSFFANAALSNGPEGETGLTYSFTFNNAMIIGLDQYKAPHRVNQDWLDSQLAALEARRATNPCPHVFVFGHEPAVQVTGSDCLATENSARDMFLQSITAAGCRMYMCGHDHLYNRARLAPSNAAPVMQIVSGSGGAPFQSWDGVYGKDYGEGNMASNCYAATNIYGYLLVTVSNFNVTMEWKGSPDLVNWQTYDTFSFQTTNPAIRNFNDYDGDSRADPAVYSEKQGSLVIAKSASGYQSRSYTIGGEGAVMAPGDYDGDGLSDQAVYWKYSGTWQIALSDHAGAVASSILGGNGFLPAPADFDGDGLADRAVYNRTSGQWMVTCSGSGGSITLTGYWGGPDYDPIPSDFDGDGKADIVVYRKNVGDWQALLTGGRALGSFTPCSVYWGGGGCAQACADYDGDGLTDLAFYDSQTGNIFASLSASGYQTFLAQMNLPNAARVMEDYDGDRKTDPMLYAEPSAYWLAALSGGGYLMAETTFGGPGWSALNYENQHSLVFLAFGDSITYGGGTSSGGPPTAYPMLLETKLKDNYPGYFLSINAGNPGETTSEGLTRFALWLDTNDPDLVLIMEGTNDEFFNDPYSTTESNLRSMVQMVLMRGKNAIIATIPPVISNSYRDRSAQQARIMGFNPRIYQIAADYNIPLAPVFEAITAVPNWQNALMDQPSANHPNDAGTAVIRDVFYSIISAQLDAGNYY